MAAAAAQPEDSSQAQLSLLPDDLPAQPVAPDPPEPPRPKPRRRKPKASPEEAAAALEQMRKAKAEKEDRSALTDEEASALMQKRGCDRARIAGILRIRQEGDLPEGFRHWGIHAEKLIPCDAIPWTCASGLVEWQLNPDTPPIDENGRPMKYLFRKGCGGLVGVLPGSEELVLDVSVPLLIVEGTYQGRAVATALEGSANRHAVVQVSGCDGWMTGGAPSPEFSHIPLRGREVFFLPDADVKTNRGVYDAAKYLRENLLDEYLARDVRIIHLPGRGNDGADDVLSRHSQEHNQEMVLLWIEKARGKDGQLSAKPPRKPRRNSGFFTEQGQFQPVDFWRYLEQKHHLALNGDKAVALYEGGVYRNSDSRRWNRAVEEALGNDFVPQYLNTVSEIAHSSLKVSGKEVPTFLAEPLLNVANGLVDLRTGRLLEHSPEVITTTQLPIQWDPAATCPIWEALIESALPGQIERLEDVMSQALDWTRAPVKILLLYGASRAGKGLILRVLEQIMGRGNYSAVTLHQLSDDRFMVAELYGKRANIAGELKPEEVRDISAVKMLTGEDPIQANKKYGATFTFYSYAFLAFSCNKLPPINETTKAFTSRVAPFHFTVGHDGREDLTLAAKLRAELPGILVRLVKAWQRREERGGFLPVDPATALHFGQNIDHVARFLTERTAPVEKLTDGLKRPELFQLWQQWCAEENLTLAARTARNTFFEKVRNQGARDGKDRFGTYRWWVKAADNGPADGTPGRGNGNGPSGDGNDSDGGSTPDGSHQPAGNGGDGAVDGDAEGSSAVAETLSPTGKSTPKRQKRQKSAETSKPSETTPPPTTGSNHIHTERYGGGSCKPAVIAVIEPPTPRPYAGLALAGIDYCCRGEDLPNPADLPLLVGFDLETFNRRTDLLRHEASKFPFLGGEIRLAQIHTGQTTLVVDVAVIGQSALDWLAGLVRDPERTLVGHNLLFEATYLIAAGIRPLCRWWDTMLASQILSDYAEHNLKAAALNYLGREIAKEEQTSDWGNELTAAQLRYAALDAVVVLPLRDALQKELERTEQVEVHRLDCQVICPAADGQVRGLAINPAVLAQVEKETKAELEPLLDRLYAELEPHGLPPRGKTRPHRGPAFAPALAAATGLDLKVSERDKTTGAWRDKLSTQKDVLRQYRGVPLIDLVLQIKGLETSAQTAAQLRRDVKSAGGRTYPNYKIVGANTGRMTTSGQIGSKVSAPSDTEVFGPDAQKAGQPVPVKLPQIGANFQGFKGGLKRALHTGNPDTVLIDADWDGQEIRLQASPKLYNDPGFRREVLDNEDSHTKMALTLFDLPVPSGTITKLRGCTEEQRSAAKPANFSIPYGCGAAKLQGALSAAQGKQVPLFKAEQLVVAWHRDHPGTSGQMEFCDNNVVLERRSVAGRRICSRKGNPGADGRQPMHRIRRTNGANWPVQASGRDLLADALGDLWVALDRFPGVRVVGLIHDEILLEAPRELAEEVKRVVVECMTSPRLQDRYLGDIPLLASAKVGESWGEVH